MAENVGWSATNSLRADLAAHVVDPDLSFHKARADLVVVMDGGRVVARGDAGELMKSSGLFREMWGSDNDC